MSQTIVVDPPRDLFINMTAIPGAAGAAGKNADSQIFGSYANSLYMTPMETDTVTATTESGIFAGNGTKLVGSGYSVASSQGDSIAVSGDGKTMAVGGSVDNNNIGATWIYYRSDTSSLWSQQGSKLVGTGYVGTDIKQGTSLSLSYDGNTLAVGGSVDNNYIGATWIFTRSGTTWTQQGTKLVGTGVVGSNIKQGSAVSLSSDGNTLAVGGIGDNSSFGATWVFTRSGTTWSQQGNKLLGTGLTSYPSQGSSVSLSSDGNTLAVGVRSDNAYVGATLIFTRSGTTWSQQGSKLVGSGQVPDSQQGFSVSLSSDGNTVAVGGFGDNANVGAVWVFTRSGTTWTQQGTKLLGNVTSGLAMQGYSVSLSGDGNILAVGCPLETSGNGAVLIYKRTGTSWLQKGNKLVVTYTSSRPSLGTSVSISTDGKTVVSGGKDDSLGIGAAWVWDDALTSTLTLLSLGRPSQGPNSVAIGPNSGKTSQAVVAAAAGYQSGGTKLVGTGNSNTTAAVQGTSVSLSGDGKTLAVGGTGDESNQGAVWIFIKSGGVWTQQGNKLVGTGFSGYAYQGKSVCLSFDGNTLAVGGHGDNSFVGATWIFIRTGTTWTQQGNKLIGTGNAAGSAQGASVSLSSDGNTLAVGGNYDNSSMGATWIFTRSGTTWTQQGNKLVGTGVVGTVNINQGRSVSLSSDGNTLAVGGFGDSTDTGATWVFIRSGTAWSQQGNKLVGANFSGSPYQGYSVSLSGEGNTLAIGGINNYDGVAGIGATWIFTRSGTTWTQQGTKLVGTGYVSTPYQGQSLSLSSTGNILAVGGRGDTNNIATWIFMRSGGVWSQQGNKLVGSGSIGSPTSQGTYVSLSHDGITLGSGSPTDNSNIGATWVFENASLYGSSIAIGNTAAAANQGSCSIAIGCQAGQVSQGIFSTAIGNQAGQIYQPSNSFFLSTSGMRNINAAYNYCQYNTASGEISYCTTGYSSDARLKKNISNADITTGSDMERILKEIKIKNFKFLDPKMSKATYGVIANDIATINNFGPQSVKTTESFIPNMRRSATVTLLDKDKKEMKEMEEKEENDNQVVFLRLSFDNSGVHNSNPNPDASLNTDPVVRVGDRLRYFTYDDNVIPDVEKETSTSVDHQTEVIDADVDGVIVQFVNNGKVTPSVAYVYGTFLKDVLVMEDPLNFIYVLIGNSQNLLNVSDQLDTMLKSMEQKLV